MSKSKRYVGSCQLCLPRILQALNKELMLLGRTVDEIGHLGADDKKLEALVQARDKERADKEKTTDAAHDKDATAAPAPAAAA